MNQQKQSILSDTENHPQTLIDVRDKSKRFDSLTNIQIWAYGVGHFINDLVSACWFNYLFFFLKRIVQTPAASAAILGGQITDGIATPIVGYLSDKIKTRFGQRTPWYVFGLVLVSACYLPIYQTFHSDNKTNQYIYYIIFPSLFNVGWASLQISHMSLVPALTCSRKRRDKLNNLRNTFTFISSFVVLGLGLIIFSVMSQPELQYAIISYIVLALGLSTSIFFLYHIRQVPLSQQCAQKAQKLKKKVQQNKISLNANISVQFSDDSDNIQGIQLSKRQRLKKKQSVLDWFKMPKFYLFGICYMGVRLYANMFGTLLPFYLVGVLNLGLEQQTTSSVPFTVALVPLIVYLSSVLVSARLNWFYQKFGRKKALFVGTLISLACIIPMLFLTKDVGWIVYILAVFVGASQTMVLATGINFISDVVGTKAKTGAFVFGIYSLLDKFSAGITIFLIGNTQAYSKDAHQLNNSEKDFIRYTMVLIPCLSSVLATAIVLSYPIKQYKKNDNKKNVQKNPKSSISEELVT